MPCASRYSRSVGLKQASNAGTIKSNGGSRSESPLNHRVIPASRMVESMTSGSVIIQNTQQMQCGPPAFCRQMRRTARRYVLNHSLGSVVDWMSVVKAEHTAEDRPACECGQLDIVIKGYRDARKLNPRFTSACIRHHIQQSLVRACVKIKQGSSFFVDRRYIRRASWMLP